MALLALAGHFGLGQLQMLWWLRQMHLRRVTSYIGPLALEVIMMTCSKLLNWYLFKHFHVVFITFPLNLSLLFVPHVTNVTNR